LTQYREIKTQSQREGSGKGESGGNDVISKLDETKLSLKNDRAPHKFPRTCVVREKP